MHAQTNIFKRQHKSQMWKWEVCFWGNNIPPPNPKSNGYSPNCLPPTTITTAKLFSHQLGRNLENDQISLLIWRIDWIQRVFKYSGSAYLNFLQLSCRWMELSLTSPDYPSQHPHSCVNSCLPPYVQRGEYTHTHK